MTTACSGCPSRWARATIVGGGTILGGILHTLPFLLPAFGAAMGAALLVVLGELVALARIRRRFFDVPFRSSLATVAVGGVLIAAVSGSRRRHVRPIRS